MAFVFRDERKTLFTKVNPEVGPGTETHNHMIHPRTTDTQALMISSPKSTAAPKPPKPTCPSASWNRAVRNPSSKSPPQGPGSMRSANRTTARKWWSPAPPRILRSYKSRNRYLCSSRPPRGLTNKSRPKRLRDPANKAKYPSYKQHPIGMTDKRFRPDEAGASGAKPKIIEHLIKINKYQSIPSIPSNVHAYGYNENQRSELELNEPPIQILKGEKGDLVGPGHYNVGGNLAERKRGISWQNSKVPKIQDPKPPVTGAAIGPGSYEPKNFVPAVNFKPSSQFISSTIRQTDINIRKAGGSRMAKQSSDVNRESRVMSEKAPESTHYGDDSSDDEYEFVDDSTPGPGAYLEISQTRTSKPRKTQHFGSTSRRFPELTAAARNLLGPGEYAPPMIGATAKSSSFRKNIKAPFGVAHPRFAEPVATSAPHIAAIPGPGAYEPRNTLEDRLIFKIQRGYRGQFGSTEQRFKEYTNEDHKLGPGMYNTSYQPNQEEAAENSVFKSKTAKTAALGTNKKDLTPPPGAYNLNYFDLSRNVIKEEEEDPELVIRKPGFGVGADRFKYNQRKEDPFDDDDIIHQIQTKAQMEQKQKKNMAPFNSKEPRLPQKLKDVPGPGTYEATQDPWNKRTFNILFADI